MSLETVTKSEVRPPLGMSCTRCIAAGHSCAASAYDAGVAVCHYCLDDVPCPMATRSLPLRTGLDDGVPLRQPQPRRHFGNMTMPDPMCTRGCGARRHRGACKGKPQGTKAERAARVRMAAEVTPKKSEWGSGAMSPQDVEADLSAHLDALRPTERPLVMPAEHRNCPGCDVCNTPEVQEHNRRLTALPSRFSPSSPIDPPNAGRHARTITLASGGYITLSVTLDWFALSVAERKFVFDLVDALDAYQGGAQ